MHFESEELLVVIMLLSAALFSLLILIWKIVTYYIRIRSVRYLETHDNLQIIDEIRLEEMDNNPKTARSLTGQKEPSHAS